MSFAARARVQDVAHDGIFVRDLDDVITYCNSGAEEQYAWTREQAVGKEASLARMVATSSLGVRGMRDDATITTFKAAAFAGATRRF
jgi:PAS domain-containing protein